MDVMLPLECLAEMKQLLVEGLGEMPPWATEADRPRFLEEIKQDIAELEAHVAQHGNIWPEPCPE